MMRHDDDGGGGVEDGSGMVDVGLRNGRGSIDDTSTNTKKRGTSLSRNAKLCIPVGNSSSSTSANSGGNGNGMMTSTTSTSTSVVSTMGTSSVMASSSSSVVTGGISTSNNSSNSSSNNTPSRRKKKSNTVESVQSKMIKYMALFLLVAQMVGLVLLMRYTRTHTPDDQPLYLASTAVFVMEVMKCVICLVVISYQSHGNLLRELNHHIVQSPMEVCKLCVPSLLYTIQNNLLYLALTNLDAATYQVCYQLKILTTALFSSALLGRSFSFMKWTSLVILTLGVAIVQISGSGDQHSGSSRHNTDNTNSSTERFIGLIAVLCAACTSGFSGVYFEKILKGSQTSLWVRNVQMGLPSILIAYITVYMKDSTKLSQQGFFGGYTVLVWTVVTVQAAGGLIVAVVVKYADNVLKVFATSFSIVISCIISAFLFDFRPTFTFILGASFVVLATIMYSSPDHSTIKRKRRPKTILPMTQAKKIISHK